MAIGNSPDALHKARDASFEEKCELSEERRKELGSYEDMLDDLQRVSRYSLQGETINFIGALFGFAGAFDFKGSGKVLESLGQVSTSFGKLLGTSHEAKKQALQGKLQLLQERIQDTRTSRQEIVSLLHEFDRALREIKSAEHEARKQIMRPR